MDDKTLAWAAWHVLNDVDPVDGSSSTWMPEIPEDRIDATLPPKLEAQELDTLAKDGAFIKKWRARLGDLSWFMRLLKEPLARKANIEDQCSGHFWEGRFKSIPLLGAGAVTMCMAYVDLNPVRAGCAKTPESARFSSFPLRVQQEQSSAHTNNWLTPISDATANGKFGFTWAHYLRIVDSSGRRLSAGKTGAIPKDLPPILERLGLNAQDCIDILTTPHSLKRGSALGDKTALKTEARRRGMDHINTFQNGFHNSSKA